MINQTGNFFQRTDFRLLTYGVFSNWGLVILTNIIGMFLINIIGLELVWLFTPIAFGLIGIALYFPLPRSHDFRLGYIIGFFIGFIVIFKFYYPLFRGL